VIFREALGVALIERKQLVIHEFSCDSDLEAHTILKPLAIVSPSKCVLRFLAKYMKELMQAHA
jgi:hypothetical protein